MAELVVDVNHNDYSGVSATGEFLEELSRSAGIPADQLVLTVGFGTNNTRGTWVHPDVAINLGQWCSPAIAESSISSVHKSAPLIANAIDKSTLTLYTSPRLKRTIILVSEEPSKLNGKARLNAYGIRAVATVAGVSPKTVARAVAGGLRMDCLESVRAWTTKRKLKP